MPTQELFEVPSPRWGEGGQRPVEVFRPRLSNPLSALRASVANSPDQLVERVAAAPATIPEEYWYPAVTRPRRANLWNTLNRTRHLQPV